MVTPPHISLDTTSDTSPNISSAGPSDVATDMTRRCALKVMGIPQYVSKFDFPGAATAERAVLPSTSSVDLSDAEPTVSVDVAGLTLLVGDHSKTTIIPKLIGII